MIDDPARSSLRPTRYDVAQSSAPCHRSLVFPKLQISPRRDFVTESHASHSSTQQERRRKLIASQGKIPIPEVEGLMKKNSPRQGPFRLLQNETLLPHQRIVACTYISLPCLLQ